MMCKEILKFLCDSCAIVMITEHFMHSYVVHLFRSCMEKDK